MRVLELCDYAAKYKGNVIESYEYLSRKCFGADDLMVYAFPQRILPRRDLWYDDFSRESKTAVYSDGFIKKVLDIRRVVKKNRLDIVHTRFTDLKTDFAVNIACIGLGVKKIKHYCTSFGKWGGIKKIAADLCYRKWSVISASDALSDEAFYNIDAQRKTVINNAVYFPRLDDYDVIKKTEIGFSENCVLYFMMGYDYTLKGIDLACEAVKNLREKFDACLAISVSSNVEKITRQITEQLGGFPEWIKILPPRQDIATYYRLGDVYVQASRSEGFCNAIIEAAYCERCVVSSDCEGITCHAREKMDFFWFKNGDASDLARSLEEAAFNKDNKSILEKNKISAIENYGVDALAEKLYNEYSAVFQTAKQ